MNGAVNGTVLSQVFYEAAFCSYVVAVPPQKGSVYHLQLRSPAQLELKFVEEPRILVVDDDHDTAEMLSFFFSTHGYSVETVHTGSAALEKLALSTFDIVLLDVFIPDIGGMEVLTEVNKLPSPPGVVLLTALADREIARDALRLGAFDYILKPADLIHLESIVVACLSHNEYRRKSWWRRLVS